MNVLIFGATGHGWPREYCGNACLTRVCNASRRSVDLLLDRSTRSCARLCNTILWQYADIETDLTGFDACFFCLGVASSGMTEEAYSRVTYDITMAAAETLCRLNPQIDVHLRVRRGHRPLRTWTGSCGRESRGRTEKALSQLPFADAYMFRPGVIEPRHGARSKTASYRVLYTPDQTVAAPAAVDLP